MYPFDLSLASFKFIQKNQTSYKCIYLPNWFGSIPGGARCQLTFCTQLHTVHDAAHMYRLVCGHLMQMFHTVLYSMWELSLPLLTSTLREKGLEAHTSCDAAVRGWNIYQTKWITRRRCTRVWGGGVHIRLTICQWKASFEKIIIIETAMSCQVSNLQNKAPSVPKPPSFIYHPLCSL